EGARVLLTNTFQAIHSAIAHRGEMFAVPGRSRAAFGLTALQAGACALARSACRPDGFVLADIGSYVHQTTKEEFPDYSMLRDAVRFLGPVAGVLLAGCPIPRLEI